MIFHCIREYASSTEIFDFLLCKIATIAKSHIVRTIPIYAKVLHSELFSFCVTVPTSLTWCKTKGGINIH